MPGVPAERRSAPRHAMVLAAEVVELPRGAKLSARTSDTSQTGCYIDTLNPIPQGAEIRLRVTHGSETFETLARVVYVSYGLGMGIVFGKVEDTELAKLDRWFPETGREF
ncbi:MAG TPA: PilZ domain-containing protein [Candidatus Limnocylindrales bacterium]|jgi:PilZ domain-containing protein|nr:PilZ domain-containing protein [Candidatus Limnocylindrales bacterium]